MRHGDVSSVSAFHRALTSALSPPSPLSDRPHILRQGLAEASALRLYTATGSDPNTADRVRPRFLVLFTLITYSATGSDPKPGDPVTTERVRLRLLVSLTRSRTRTPAPAQTPQTG